MSNDMGAVIVPKSDQLNADDLIAGPITVTITGVTIKPGEQPISIHYEGDNGKPYKACKSMARVMVMAWGSDSKKYTGRSMTLYRDPSVKWAGMEVGGIRISHMTDIDGAITMALTATKGSRKPYTVKPLTVEDAAKVTPEQIADLETLCKTAGVEPAKFLKMAKAASFAEILEADYETGRAFLQGKIDKAKPAEHDEFIAELSAGTKGAL